MFIIWQKQEQFNLFDVTGLYKLTFRLQSAMNQIQFFQSFRVPFTFFLISFLALTEINIARRKTVNDFAF